MDGRRHETSMRLIAASIPAQALMMAGVAALVLGAVPHGQPVPTIQVSPAQLTKPAPAYVDPAQPRCWLKEPAGAASPAGAMSPADWKPGMMACAWLESAPGSPPSKVTITTDGSCCGG